MNAQYPMMALREAITNAVMHRDWFMEGANVFVELYTDRIEVSSPGGLPKGMVLTDLGRKSIRRNTLIADLLHRIEFIEKGGTGIKRIRDDARDQGCPPPSFENSGFFTATFLPNPEVRVRTQAFGTGFGTRQVPDKLPTSIPQALAVLKRACKPASRCQLQQVAGLRDREHFVKSCLNPLLASGALERTLPDKPRSPMQRYRTTELGQQSLARERKGP